MLCCIAMVAKYLDLNKPWSCKYGRKKGKIMTCMTFLCMSPRHRQVGSLAGAAHLSNDNAGVLR